MGWSDAPEFSVTFKWASAPEVTPGAPVAKAAEKVIATTPDGGRIVEMPDGTRSFTSPGYSTNDPAQIDKIMQGATPAAVSTSSFDQSTLATSPAAAKASKIVQGIPFVGQYADEALGLVAGHGAKQNIRSMQDAMDRESPWASAGLQVLGGIAGAIPMAAAAGPAIMARAPASLASKVVAGGLTGAATGLAEGAVSGYGRGNDGDRLGTAKNDAMLGAAFGGAVGAAAPAIGQMARELFLRVRGMDIKAIAKELGISETAAKALKPDLDALDFQQAQAAIAKSGPEAMLADAGLPTREALDSAITGGGKAARIGVDAVTTRAEAAGTKLGKVMDAVLGVPRGVKSAARSISQRTSAIRKAAYDAAYAKAIDYSSDAGRKIEEVLGRIPGPTLNAAIKEANEAMLAAGIKNKQIMAQIGPDGAVKFVEMPNVQQLDEIKKALGSLGAEVDNLGRPTGQAIRANKLGRELKEAISDAVDIYARAVKLGGDKIAEDRALDMGRKVFGPAVSRETVADMMDGASLEAKEAARQGIREYIDDTLARVRRDFANPDADTQETLRLLGQLSSRDAREKLSLILGPDKAARLLDTIDSVGVQFGTRRAIATGSATGRRDARRRAIDEILAPGVIGNAARGKGINAVQSLIGFLTRATPAEELAKRQQVLSEVATALTAIRGPQAQAALALIEKALTGQLLKNDEAAAVARLAATSTALGGYLSGTRGQTALKSGPR